MKIRSISTKVALAATLFFLAVLAGISAFEAYRVKADYRELVGRQQFSFVVNEARDIDEKLLLRKQALENTAAWLGAAHARQEIGDTASVQAAIAGRPALATLFDDLFVFSLQGRVVANHPYVAGRSRTDVNHRAYFQEVLATGKSVISEPYQSKLTVTPNVMIAVPVRDAQGRLLMVLGGQINLLRPNFLGAIGDAKVGETGSFAIFTRQRTILMSREKERIMQPGPRPGLSPYFDHVMAGRSGWEEAVNSRGMKAIYSYQQLSATPWALVAALPTDEAYAPAAASQRRLLVLAAGLSLLVALAAWLGARVLLRPVAALRDSIRALRDNPQLQHGPRLVHAAVRGRDDELGDLARDFADLMEERAAATDALRAREAELRETAAGLRESASILRVVTDHLPVPIAYVDRQERYRFANATLGQWLGIDQNRLIGMSLLERFGPEEYARIAPQVATVMGGQPVTYERQSTYNGVLRDVRVSSIPDFGADGTVLGFYTLVHDVSETMQVQRELQHSAQHDVLTGLPNRALFEDRLAHALALSRRNKQSAGLMYLDLDRFKNINDTYGHDAGDALLREFAQRIRACVRATDTVARLGGDEFTVVLEQLAHPEDAVRVAEKILYAMAAPVQLGEHAERAVHVSTSIGIAVARADECGASALLVRADRALYAAKQKGRNTYAVYGEDPAPALMRLVRAA